MSLSRLLLAAWPGLSRLLALLAMLATAALAGAVHMAERIARDEATANRNAYLESP